MAPPRQGFTLVEFVVAMVALTVAGTIVAQTATWAVRERVALEERDRAVTIAENLLETAKVQPQGRFQNWADGVRLPKGVLTRWPRSTLKVTVEEDRGLKRVTVAVLLTVEQSPRTKPFVIIGWLAPPAKGVTP